MVFPGHRSKYLKMEYHNIVNPVPSPAICQGELSMNFRESFHNFANLPQPVKMPIPHSAYVPPNDFFSVKVLAGALNKETAEVKTSFLEISLTALLPGCRWAGGG